MIPRETFTAEDGLLFADDPFPDGQGWQWYKRHAQKFVYTKGHIIREAIPIYGVNVPSQSGIYFLLIADEIVYCGQANQLDWRIGQHQHKREKIFDRYWCFGGVPKRFMDRIEAFYIAYLRPSSNLKFPAVDEVMGPILEGLTGSENDRR